MKLGNGFAPVKEMLDVGVNISLGTDGAASNNSLNLFSEMNMAALIYKGNLQDSQAVSAKDVFSFVTKNAAKAVGMEDDLGEIKVGKKADLCIMNMEEPAFRPKNDILSALSYSVSGYETESVIEDGKILMEKKELKTIDEEKTYYMAEKICERIGIERRY
jgi:5-methylthioadenosine/S-adenosylhomocysteine deaminase